MEQVLTPPPAETEPKSAVPTPEHGILAQVSDSFFEGMKRAQLTIGGKTVSVETGRMARLADASVLVQCGESLVIVAVTRSEKPRPGIDFFPLLVDFEEKMYSVGRMPGGYMKREGRPSEKAVLTSRLIDRPVRPLFPDGYRNDVQIVATPLCADSVEQTDVMAIFGASLALTLAEKIPFQGPLGAVRVGRIDGALVINPTFAQSAKSDLDLVVAGTATSIMMVEAGAQFVDEALLVEALELAHKAIQEQVQFQLDFAKTCGVKTDVDYVPDYDIKPLVEFIASAVESDVTAAYHNTNREARQVALAEAKAKAKAALEALDETHELRQLVSAWTLDLFGESYKKVEKRVMRRMVLDEHVRADGRKLDEIRPIKAAVGVVPRVHGSALFTRGSTQALSVCTLGSPGDAQDLDGVDPATKKRWIHHYSFPAFSVGEVRPNRGAGRREIGHGALAERAVAASLPTEEAFPYTLRVNSDILESNGSSSMASTCGSTLALMDAGVPLTDVVGGIAMGLIQEEGKTAILSDIQGLEDFLGDMDFKVTGSRKGVTALQMDIKIQGISLEVMKQALEQARVGRLHILDKMAEALAEPRPKLSQWAPRIITVKIDPEQIGMVIGPGGKMIRSIVEETGAQIDIEDDGRVLITALQGPGGERAVEIIKNLTKKINPGEMIKGKVVGMIPIGAFVQLAPGRDGMIHISQFPVRVATVEDAVKVGDDVLVRVVDVDDKGRVSLTTKGISDEERAEHGLPPFVVKEAPPGTEFGGGGRGDRDGGGRPPRRDGGDRGGRDGGGYRGGGNRY
jgi:polyribonucleotide nucleotidyltransferase